jgi:hypothetical protein
VDENNLKVYLPAVELLKVTTKIESLLEHLGGVGARVYDKVKSTEYYF